MLPGWCCDTLCNPVTFSPTTACQLQHRGTGTHGNNSQYCIKPHIYLNCLNRFLPRHETTAFLEANALNRPRFPRMFSIGDVLSFSCNKLQWMEFKVEALQLGPSSYSNGRRNTALSNIEILEQRWEALFKMLNNRGYICSCSASQNTITNMLDLNQSYPLLLLIISQHQTGLFYYLHIPSPHCLLAKPLHVLQTGS